MSEKKGFHIGRKFVAFILCLITFIVMGVIGKGEGMAPYIVGLFVAYTTGNVAQKATAKSENVVTVKQQDINVEVSDER